jgi:hypothetical protein
MGHKRLEREFIIGLYTHSYLYNKKNILISSNWVLIYLVFSFSHFLMNEVKKENVRKKNLKCRIGAKKFNNRIRGRGITILIF